MAIKISRARTTIELCTDMGLRLEWEAANAALDKAKQGTSGMLNDPELKKKAEIVVDIENRMGDSILLFDVQALQNKKWQEHEANHPPRDGSKDDEVYGVNCSTFFDEIIPPSIFAVREKTTSKVVDFDPAKEWGGLADDMSNGQYNEFAVAILRLNRGATGVPFSLAASRLTVTSDKN